MMRSDLPKWFKEQGYQKGAEIGVFMGEFTKKLCKEGLQVYAVDPWKAYSLEESQERQDLLYNRAKERLLPYPNCTIIRKTAMDALADFEDGSLDFVFLDGDHGFKAIADELVEWSKKVRVGGAVCGHDYDGQSSKFVRPVVDAYVKAYGINTLQILKNSGAPRDRGDITQSFLWIKQ